MMKAGMAADAPRNDVRSAEVRPAREMKWTPIEDLPAEANEWIGQDYLAERARWHEASAVLQDPALDRSILDLWTEERHRLSAIETGQIENLYTMRLGMTEMLIAEGLENARSSHTIEGVLDDQTLQGLLRDQRDAMEMVFRTVKDERPLSESVIKEWHALLTRHQDTAPGIDQHGRRVGIPFLKGVYKRRPNNPRTADGTIHEYCPPEHTASEMERLVAMHHEHERHRPLPATDRGRMAAPSLRADPSVRGRERTHRATPDELRLRQARRADTGDHDAGETEVLHGLAAGRPRESARVRSNAGDEGSGRAEVRDNEHREHAQGQTRVLPHER